MRIAIPANKGEFSLDFINCDQFLIVDVGTDSKAIFDAEYMTPLSFDLKTLPIWLRENNVDVIVAGGMPQETKNVFAKNHIDIHVGFLHGSIAAVMAAFLDNLAPPDGTTKVDTR